jgi:hypothetical protein
VRFELRWLQTPLLDRLLAPLSRSWLRRGNERAMQRLAESMAATNSRPRLGGTASGQRIGA